MYSWIIAILLILVILVMTLVGVKNTSYGGQVGGEYFPYFLMPSRQHLNDPLGYLTDQDYIPPNRIVETRHASPSRTQSNRQGLVKTDGTDERCPTGDYYKYYDTFNWYPYDWRPFEWRPYWMRRAELCPSAKNCAEKATDQCIGTGASDYQSCYEAEKRQCLDQYQL